MTIFYMHNSSLIVLQLHINLIIRDIFGICKTILFCMNFIFKVIFLRLMWINNFKSEFTVYIFFMQARARRCGLRKQIRRSKVNQRSMNGPYKSPSDEATISSNFTRVASKTTHPASHQHRPARFSNHICTSPLWPAHCS